MISKFLSKVKSILFKSEVSPEAPLKKEKKPTKTATSSKTKIKTKTKTKTKAKAKKVLRLYMRLDLKQQKIL